MPDSQISILLVEDEESLAAVLVQALEREGYAASWVDSGRKALTRLAQPGGVDLVILDLGLPDADGLDVCGQLRHTGYHGAIMMVSARAAELDRVVGLDVGADDYLAKPFGLAELLARVRALLRRHGPSEQASPDDGLRIDVTAYRAYVGDREIALTVKEFGLLALLVGAHGQVVSREQLMTEVWDQTWRSSSKAIDATVSRLRRKLEDAGVRDRVVGVRGLGFRFESAP